MQDQTAEHAPRPAPLERLTSAPGLDWAVGLLGTVFLGGAYVDAWARLQTPVVPDPLTPYDEVAVVAGWLLITVLLVGTLAGNLRARVPFSRALPAGYHTSLVGCLIFGMTLIVDFYLQAAFSFGSGLEALLSPTHVLEILTGGLIVAGPLRAAVRRRIPRAPLPALLSAALLLSTLSFFTQFANPLVDLWAATGSRHPLVHDTWWVEQDLGAAGIFMQAILMVTMMLLLLRHFEVRPGTWTLILSLNGLLMVSLKTHWFLLPVPIATGAIADLVSLRLRPSADRPVQARGLVVATPMVFTALYLAALELSGGTWWALRLWAGLILAPGVVGWLLSQLMFPSGIRAATAEPAASGEWTERWPRHTAAAASPQQIKNAFETLHDPRALAGSPLAKLACISGDGDAAGEELRSLLVDVVREMAASKQPRDAEAGRLMLDYYVRRAGSHEVIAEALHLTRPTFYRRLQRGLTLAAERVDELSEFASRQLV